MNVRIWSHFVDETWSGEIDEPLLDPLVYPEDNINETLFRLFNRVEAGDGLRLEALDYRLPSLSVGDRIEWDGRAYAVAALGFVAVDGLVPDCSCRWADDVGDPEVGPDPYIAEPDLRCPRHSLLDPALYRFPPEATS